MDRIELKKSAGENLPPFWGSFILPILRYRKLTYVIVASSVLVAIAYSVMAKNNYTSAASILPSGEINRMSELKSLAAGSLDELDLGILVQAPENSSMLYPKILSSRLISEKILKRNYSFIHKNQNISMSLQEYLDAANIDYGMQGLKELIKIDTDMRTGIVQLLATTKYPELSSAIVHAYIEELDNYNVHHRRSRAAGSEKFISRRLAEVNRELQQAEDTLKSFREKNMNYLKSDHPGLQLLLSRLQRNVELKAALYMSLNQQHELARLEAAKDVPIVQVLDSGAVPLVKSSPRRSVILIAAFFGSLVCSVLLSLWLDLSYKRQIKRSIDRVISSPGVRLNKLEERLVERVAGIPCVSEQKNSRSDKNLED
jgi:uncharacterized protein involved in exopolysaccharide biosynthesis